MNKCILLVCLNLSYVFSLFDCDFDAPCEWTWKNEEITIGNSTFLPGRQSDSKGHFLYYGTENSKDDARLEIISPQLEEGSGNLCSIDFELRMNMNNGFINILVSTDNTTWIVQHIKGNSENTLEANVIQLLDQIQAERNKIILSVSKTFNNKTVFKPVTCENVSIVWQRYKKMIGRVTQRFRVVVEIEHPKTTRPLYVAIDNLKLVNCIRDRSSPTFCEPQDFRCTQGICYERDRVCDLIPDCPEGEDEREECDILPKGSRCSFEEGFCGWTNINDNYGNWTHSSGSIAQNKGPNYDHTYKNATGTYIFANFFSTGNTFGHQAILRSDWFRPPPFYHRQPGSTYHQSCKVRFHYHLNLAAHLWLEYVVLNNKLEEGTPISLWSIKRNQGNVWHRVVVALPNITSSFALQFVATSGVRVTTGIAIDDVSLSPECFGFGVPQNETRNASLPNEKQKSAKQNGNYRYVFGTCNASGHLGPTISQCAKTYRNTSTQISMKQNHIFAGMQIWNVPETNLYTLFAGGASGGQGVNNRGISKGAIVRATFNWTAGETIYILIGQKGTSACSSNILMSLRKQCKDDSGQKLNASMFFRPMEKRGGGAGGGGGATFVFKLKESGHPDTHPLLVAAGGGGLSSRLSNITSLTHGQANGVDLRPKNGHSTYNRAGGGGGWNDKTISHTDGESACEGGRGGRPCFKAPEWLTYGGFGGGGGGCNSGGGGGGYKGGEASKEDNPYDNGLGGISFVSSQALLPFSQPEMNEGDGFLEILPAQRGCGCQYLCIVTQKTGLAFYCICPPGIPLEDDGKSCSGFPSHRTIKQTLYTSQLVVTVLSCLAVLAIVAFVAVLTLTRYRSKRADKAIHKPLENAELQLSLLRQSGGRMVTEYNPNYEFGGSACSIQDLREIPRETLTLAKALGQGAFGEVYQGYLVNLPDEAGDIPVAVKTLPEFSSNEAEMDFLMEALIMSKFNHPNIVRFIGVCFEKLPRFIILELLLGGDLKSFLRESRPKPNKISRLNMADLLNLALDVAEGCQYLEDHHFIHRDIAARNCLLTMKGPRRVVKIADFGMARDIYRSDYYRKGGKAMLPIKWMPPEAFLDGIFTCKTDVWSFGVLLWEVMSLGYMPYPGRGNQEVMQLITSGGRLEPPTNCPNPVYHVMRQCWHPIPDERPCFNTVIERVGYCLQDPDVLNAPLPVFHRPPSMERDATVMRPLDCESLCLQVQRPEREIQSPNSEEYTIPMPSSNYSLSTERTELQTSSSESIDKLLEINDSEQDKTALGEDSKPKRADGYSELPFISCDRRNITRFSSLKSLDSVPLATKVNQAGMIKLNANSMALDIIALGKTATDISPFQYINVDVNSNSRSRLDNVDQTQLNHNILDKYSCSNPAVSPTLTDNHRQNC